jgi:MFS family permease
MLTIDEKTPYRLRWLGLVALLVAEAMNLLDATIVQVAAPAIRAGLGGSLADVQWFSAAYTLPFALLLITGGRLGDLAGRRRLFRLGVIAFALASLACALAPTPGSLIGFRLVQGAAAAMIIPQTIGLIRAMFGGAEMAKAMGSIGPVMGLAAVCGPILAGVLIHADLFGSSWRAVFLVNLPLSIAVLAMAPVLLEDRAPRRPSLDPAGTAVLIAGTALIVYPLIRVPFTAAGGVAIAAGLALVVVFAVLQRRSTRPLIEVSLFAHRLFPAALGTSALFFAVTTGLSLIVVLQMQLGLGTSTLTASLTLLPWTIGMAVASVAAGAGLVARYGLRVMAAGLVVLIGGVLAAVAAYHAADPGTYPVPLLGALAVIGAGIGLFTTAFFTEALRVVAPQEVGSAAGLLNAVQQLGATLGVAVLGSVYLRGAGPGYAGLHAAQRALWVAAAMLVATAVTAAVMGRRPARPVPAPA